MYPSSGAWKDSLLASLKNPIHLPNYRVFGPKNSGFWISGSIITLCSVVLAACFVASSAEWLTLATSVSVFWWPLQCTMTTSLDNNTESSKSCISSVCLISFLSKVIKPFFPQYGSMYMNYWKDTLWVIISGYLLTFNHDAGPSLKL